VPLFSLVVSSPSSSSSSSSSALKVVAVEISGRALYFCLRIAALRWNLAGSRKWRRNQLIVITIAMKNNTNLTDVGAGLAI